MSIDGSRYHTLGYGSVVKHIKNLFHAPELYLNTTSALLILGINLLGLILNMD